MLWLTTSETSWKRVERIVGLAVVEVTGRVVGPTVGRAGCAAATTWTGSLGTMAVAAAVGMGLGLEVGGVKVEVEATAHAQEPTGKTAWAACAARSRLSPCASGVRRRESVWLRLCPVLAWSLAVSPYQSRVARSTTNSGSLLFSLVATHGQHDRQPRV